MMIMLEIMMVAIMVAMSSALLGNFLVLRGSVMVSDAITHTVLLGIVLAFFVVPDLNSPLLIIGASIVGIITVVAIEALYNTGLLAHDSATGIVFPLFFSIAIILLTRYAGDIHLDVDTVLTGELGYTIFERVSINGIDLGPTSLWRNLLTFIVNGLFIIVFYRQLKVTTFDPEYARSMGISPTIFYYALMSLVSLTAVNAYDSVGAILVVGFMVGPALSAYLLSNDLKKMIGLSLVFAIFNSVVGVFLAFAIDTNIAGMIAVITGITAFLVFLFSPKKGLLRRIYNKNKTKDSLSNDA